MGLCRQFKFRQAPEASAYGSNPLVDLPPSSFYEELISEPIYALLSDGRSEFWEKL